MFSVGDRVEVTEIRNGNRQQVKVKRKGKVLQVCDRFVVVDSGLYRECVWLDSDQESKVTMRRLSNEN